mgnify:CR=1 FL=1
MIRPGDCRRGGWSGALNKVEHYGVQRVTGDGRCMFRALVRLVLFNCALGISLDSQGNPGVSPRR